ncbi:MAG: DPP IV N-terminal domain-containing protein [Prevotella sp.]|nr:DPP IV N-terminal domain-containing protein [Prevotella sp.]
MRPHILVLLTTISLQVAAQGTAEDYRRAYALYDQLKSSNVYHWAHDVRWKDSTHVFSYRIDTPDGPQYYNYNADSLLKKVVPPPPAQMPKPRFGRHQERHWMEVDEEKFPMPVLSPDGRTEAYIEGHNVVLHPVGKPYSEKKVLSQDGTIGEYYSNRILWSPDSRYLFVCKRRPVDKRYVHYVESSPSDQLQPILHRQEYAKPGDALPFKTPVIFDTQTGEQKVGSTALCSHQYELGTFAWTPDSKEVTMEYNERGHKTYRILAMNAQTGTIRTVIEEKAQTFVNYTRHFRFDLSEGRQIIWMSERDNWNHLYLYDTATGKVVRQITKGAWCVREVLHVDEKSQVIYFSASGVNPKEDPYLLRYYRIGIDGKDMTCLTPALGEHHAEFSSDYKYLVDTYSLVDKAPVTELRSADDGRLLDTIEKADISSILSKGWRAPEVFVAKGRDGKTDMWGIIQRPTNFDPTRKYPIIEYIYAGPGSAYVPKSFNPYNWNMTPLAELGFIVVQLDAMGTSWRGKSFEEICYKNLKDAGFPDRKLWIQAAARKYPYMDADNVGIFGASAGGQESTTAVLLHGDFYKAAYSSCGCHDNRMDKIWWNEQWMGYPVDSSYVECSNVYHASKLTRPLMLVVGEMDDNVDPSSTYQLVNALITANKDFELVTLPGVRHTMGERYGEHKRFDFFVRHLLGVTPPKWNEIEAKRE